MNVVEFLLRKGVSLNASQDRIGFANRDAREIDTSFLERVMEGSEVGQVRAIVSAVGNMSIMNH